MLLFLFILLGMASGVIADPVTAAAATSPWWGPPAAAAVGGFIEAAGSSAFNWFQAQKNRDFQERMSGTSHQREVKDLIAAGLNPILSARHGASTPPGAQATAAPSSATQSALQAAQLRGTLALQAAQIRDINSAAALKDAQAANIGALQPGQLQNQLGELYAKLQSGNLSAVQQEQTKAQIRKLEAEIDVIKADAHKRRMLGGLYEEGEKAVNSGKGILQKFKNFKDEAWKARDQVYKYHFK